MVVTKQRTEAPTWKPTRYDGIYTRTDSRGRIRYRAVVWVRDPKWKPDPTKARNTPARKQLAKTFDRLENARDWREDFGGSKPKQAPRQTKVTLRELKAELEASEEYAGATLSRDGYAWAHVEAAMLADRPVGQISKDDIERALSKLSDRPEMQTKTRSMLSRLFGHAVASSRADVNLATKARKSQTRAAKKRTRKSSSRNLRLVSDGELRRLAAEIPERWRAMIELMAYEGLRPGEAVALTVGKFEPLKRTLLIDTSVTGDTKTGEPRTLKLTAYTTKLLTEHLAKFSEPTNPDAPIFPKEDGAPIDSKNAYDSWSRRHFAPAAERAGVNGGISPNDLRHHAASFAIDQGLSVLQVQKMLGHARPSITLDIYSALFDDSQEQGAEKLDAAIRANRVPVADGKVVQLR